jgi:hypothetical protein
MRQGKEYLDSLRGGRRGGVLGEGKCMVALAVFLSDRRQRPSWRALGPDPG